MADTIEENLMNLNIITILDTIYKYLISLYQIIIIYTVFIRY